MTHPLFDRAKKAELPEAHLDAIEARLEARAARPARAWALPAAAAMAVALVAAAAGLLEGRPAEPELPDGPTPSAPHFVGRVFQPPAPPARPKPRPAPRARPAPVAPQRPAAPPTEVVAARPAPPPTVRPAPPPRRARDYQPRAIREFLRVDWARWEARELPAAVARMVQRRDPIGLLAALEQLPSEAEPELLRLRKDLRAQVDGAP